MRDGAHWILAVQVRATHGIRRDDLPHGVTAPTTKPHFELMVQLSHLLLFQSIAWRAWPWCAS